MHPQTTQGSPSAEVLGVEADVAVVDAVIVDDVCVVVCVVVCVGCDVCGVRRLFNEVRVVVTRGGSDGRFPRARSRDPPSSSR